MFKTKGEYNAKSTPPKKKKGKFKNFIIGLIVIFILGSLFSGGDKEKKVANEETKAIEKTDKEETKIEEKLAEEEINIKETVSDEIFFMYRDYLDITNRLYAEIPPEQMITDEKAIELDNIAFAEIAEKKGITPEEIETLIKDNLTEIIARDSGADGTSDIVKKIANDIWKDDLIIITYTSGFVNVTHKLADNLTTDFMIKGYLRDISDFLEKTKDIKDITAVFVGAKAELLDKYGNTNEQFVLKTQLSKETIDKINFENFDYNNIPDIADEFIKHPALEK